GGEPHSAFQHGLAGDLLHLRDLFRRRFPVLEAKHLLADASLPHETSEVNGRMRVGYLLEERRQRYGGTAVLALDERGYALADVVLRRRIQENPAPGVGVDVDKTGRDCQP